MRKETKFKTQDERHRKIGIWESCPELCRRMGFGILLFIFLLFPFTGEARAGVLYYGDAQVSPTVTIDANDLLRIRQNAGGYPGVPLMGNADASGHDCRLAVSDALGIRQYMLGFRSDLPVFDPSPCWAIGLTITIGDGQEGAANQTLPQPLEVELNNLPACTQTISGCTRGGVTVTYEITGDSTGGALLNGIAQTLDINTDSSGKTQVDLLLGPSLGVVTIVASVDLYSANNNFLKKVSATFNVAAVGCIISSVGPTTGCPGDPVTITGSDFGPNTGSVTFNGTGATVTSWGNTSIEVSAPGGDYYNVAVIPLTTNGCSQADTYSYDNIGPAPPAASPPDGEYCLGESITVTTDEGGPEHCTTDGSAPDCSSSPAPATISSNMTLRCIECDTCGNPGAETVRNYAEDVTKPTVTISEPNAGECINSSVVVLNGTADDGIGPGIATVLVNGQTASGTYSWSITFTSNQYGEPVEVGSRDTADLAYGVFVSGNYAYVADRQSGLAIIDVSDPASPGTPVYRDTSGASYGVYVTGGYAYVADGGAGLAIIDVSDPASPGTPVYRDTLGQGYKVYVTGGYAYVACRAIGLAIIDVSNPTNPGAPVYQDTTDDAYDVYVTGGYAYVGARDSGLAIIDVSDPANPGTPVYRDTDGNGYGVYVTGGYAYMADRNSGLAIIDVSDPTNPSTPVIYRDTLGYSYAVYVTGGYAYVADGGAGLTIIDVSDPVNPGTPVYQDTDGTSIGVYVTGGYAYVADNDYGLRVIDVSSFNFPVFNAVAMDNCGNVSDPATVNVTIDATANVVITSPRSGVTISAGDVFVGGTADTDITTVTVTSDQGHSESSGVDPAGNWAVVLTNVVQPSLTITAQGTDNCGNTASDSVTVSVVTPQCSITIVSPTTGCPGGYVFVDGLSFGVFFGTVYFDETVAPAYSWMDDYLEIQPVPGGNFSIVRVVRNDGGMCTMPINLSYDNVPPPPPTITSPADGSIFTTTTIDTAITCAEGNCQQRLDWGVWMFYCTTTFYGVTPGAHRLEAKCTDNCSNDSVIVTSSFQVDTQAPWVVSTTPENGRTDVRTGVNIEIKFSEDMDKVSVENGFSLSSGTVGLSGDFYWGSDDTVTFVTPDLLTDNTPYAVDLVGAADLAGYSLSTTPFPFNFTTGDCTAPKVEYKSPSGNSLVDSSTLTQIKVTFDELMDTTRGLMKIRDTYGNEVVQAEVGGGSFGGSLTWSGRILILDLDFPSPIQEGAGYNIEAWDLNDQSGNWIWNDVRWSFVTQGPVSDTDPPQLTLSFPYDGQTGVPRKLYDFAQNAITLGFDEVLDPFTVTQINPVGIFSDNFESGDLIAGGWSFTTGASVDNTPVFANNLDSESTWWGYFNYGGKIWKVVDTGNYVDIQLNYQLSMFGLDAGEYFRVEYSTNGGSSWNIIEEIEGDGGNWLSWQERSFNLSALDPAVEDNSQFALRFGQNANGPADISTLDNVSLTGKLDIIALTDSSGPVSFEIDWDVGEGPSPFSIMLITDLPLDPLETYTIGISGGIKDSAGNSFIPQSISFNTADEPDDNDPPLVEATVPADGWIDLDWYGIEGDIGFNEPIDYSTVDFSAFTMKETNTGIPLKGFRFEEQENGEPTTWHLRFYSYRAFPGMKYDTQYTLTISSNTISDISGNPLVDYSWMFTTVPEGPGTGPPANRLPKIHRVWPDVNATSFQNGNVTVKFEIDARDDDTGDSLTVWVEDYTGNSWTLTAPTGSDRYEYETPVPGDYDSGDEPNITYNGWQTFTFYIDDGQPGHTISVSNQAYIWPTADLPNQVSPLNGEVITAGGPATLVWQNADTANAVFLVGQYINLVTNEQGMCFEFPEFTQTILTGLSPGLYVWMIGQMASVHGETFETGGTGVGYQGMGVSNFTVADPALGSISGTITYGGPAGGAIFVEAYTNISFTGDPVGGTIIPAPGNYTIYNLPDDIYYVRSFRDANGNMEEDWFEPWGYYDVPAPPDPVTITGGTNKQGINIGLVDPS